MRPSQALALCVWLGMTVVPTSLADAEERCPNLDGRWRDARIEEAVVFVIASDHDAIEVRWDDWNVPGPLRLTRATDGCSYTGTFRTQRWLVTDPARDRVLWTYTGTANLRVDDHGVLHLDIEGVSRDERRPSWSRTEFHIPRELTRT